MKSFVPRALDLVFGDRSGLGRTPVRIAASMSFDVKYLATAGVAYTAGPCKSLEEYLGTDGARLLRADGAHLSRHNVGADLGFPRRPESALQAQRYALERARQPRRRGGGGGFSPRRSMSTRLKVGHRLARAGLRAERTPSISSSGPSSVMWRVSGAKSNTISHPAPEKSARNSSCASRPWVPI
jgi:hypothetical protein